MSRARPDGDGKRSAVQVEGPLEDAASVLRESVDLGHSLLDEAELGTEEVPSALAERAETERGDEEADATVEAESVLAPPEEEQGGETGDPEELETRLEAASEPAELLSLHDEEPLTEALLDEGAGLDELDAQAVEDAIERRGERAGPKRATAAGRALRGGAPGPATAGRSDRGVAPPGVARPAAPAGRKLDAKRFRRLLEADRARLVDLLAEFDREGLRQRSQREDLSSLSAVDQHPADQATETFDRERDLSLREQVEGELAEVARALARLDRGTYGRCEACGRPIGAERLAAEPAARLCLDDQRELERELAVKHRAVEP